MSNASFNDLTSAEIERLALLAEECGECVQAITKILRHGYRSSNPTLPPALRVNNRTSLIRECGDVLAAIELMAKARDFHFHEVIDARDDKLRRVSKFLHEQDPPAAPADPR